MTANPFTVSISDEKLVTVLDRFRTARFPQRLGNGDWSLGMSDEFMHRFVDYVVNEYDWRAVEQRLNAHPQFRADVDGYGLHFYHVAGEGDNPTPLVLTHGWPGSVYEFLKIIESLTRPSKFGSDPADSFSVVIPSVPGYGFSTLAENKVIAPVTTANLWHKLMTGVLGYSHFGAQGGDIGSLVTSQLAARHPDSLIGVHMNLIPWAWKDDQTSEEQEWFAKGQEFQKREMDYFSMHVQKPTTPVFALADSPVGLAAWILEKFYIWSDHKGDLTSIYSMEDLATFVMMYALTDTIESSIWWYHGIAIENGGVFHPTPGKRVDVPTAFADFPKDLLIARPPRSWVEGQYDIRQWTAMPRGGHFAALEEPEALVKDIREFFGPLKSVGN